MTVALMLYLIFSNIMRMIKETFLLIHLNMTKKALLIILSDVQYMTTNSVMLILSISLTPWSAHHHMAPYIIMLQSHFSAKTWNSINCSIKLVTVVFQYFEYIIRENV